MRPFTRSPSQRRAALVAGVLLLAVGFLPLFGGPGYEQALAAGLILPAAAAIATALDVARAEAGASPLSLVARGVASGLALAAMGFATALLHGLRVGFCDLAGGARGYALTAAAGAVLGGAWGAVAGEVARRAKRTRLVAVLVSLAAPLGSVIVSLLRFYGSPMIFAFDPFVGYFSGTLYDTVIDAGMPLLTYRLGSACTLGALLLLASAAVRGDQRRLRFVALKRDPGALARFALGVVLALGSLVLTIEGAELGHWQTAGTIAKALGGHRSGPRCDVVFPDTQRADQAALLLKDCEEELANAEKVLGVHFPGRITAFFFHDAGEKKHFMGAADTYIAKPWRREVYLQVHAYPHPVLGHEIAHVVAGTMGRGPFKIAGAAGGWWPNPGLIEGVAVAVSPDEEELSDAQWGRAMLDLGILPPMKRVFSLGFLGESSAKSYTLAGAFVRWVLALRGAEVVRRWYGGEELAALVGEDWDALDRDFRASLAKETLGPEAKAYAKARFDHPSVFGRKCPHVVDALRREADSCRDSMRVDKARELYEEVLERDPHDWAARYGLGIVELRYGDRTEGEASLEALGKAEGLPRTWHDRVGESLADAALASDDPAEWARAEKRYDALAARSVDEDQGRTLEVKRYGAQHAASGDGAREALVAMLVGTSRRPIDQDEGWGRLSAWVARTGDPVGEYVLGKNLANHEFWREGAEHLERALQAGEPTVRIQRELLKQRAICACAVGDLERAKGIGEKVIDAAGPFASSVGRREWLLAFLDRCESRP